MARTVAIIQARMGSTRLPGKIALPLLGKPMLAHMLERVKLAKKLDAVVVATSEEKEDDRTVEIATQCAVEVVRGSETDVLDRYCAAGAISGAENVVRLTGDCPLHDPRVIDEVVEHFLAGTLDYAHTPKNYPEGLDTEIVSFAALKRAGKEAVLPSEREHVTLYIRNHPELFRIDPEWTSGSGEYAAMHWSVDSQADFDFVAKIYEQLYPNNPSFNKDDVLNLLAAHPEYLDINKGGTGYEGLSKSLKEDEEFNTPHE